MKVVNLEQNIFNIENLKTYYIHVGKGRAVLILHGWQSFSGAWREVVKLLAEKGFSVFVPDLPGFGRSFIPNEAWGIDDYVQFVLKFAKELKIDQFILLGHSFGGQIAIKLAAFYPEKVEKLILCAPAAIRHKKRLKVRAFYILAKIGNLIFSLPLLKLIREKIRRILYFLAREKDYQVAGDLKETMKKVISEDTRQYLSKINSETLILWGDKDRMIPVSDADTLKNGIVTATIKIIKDAGHNFPYEVPKVLVSEVLTLLEEK